MVFAVMFGGLYVLSRQPCGQYGRNSTGLSAGISESSNDYMRLLSTRACLITIEDVQDSLFGDKTIRVKLGYFDKWGIVHVYPARLGGVDFKGIVHDVDLCVNKGDINECRNRNKNEALLLLNAGKVIGVQIVTADNAPWEAAEVVTRNKDFIDNLVNAIKSGSNFPKPPLDSDFALQVWQLRI